MTLKAQLRGAASAALAILLLAAPLAAAQAGARRATPAQLRAARDYIRRNWRTLSRSNRGLAAAAVDPKFREAGRRRWPVYVSRTENLARVRRSLRAQMPAADFARIDLRRLPLEVVYDHGLLYLPHPYVVPGGRFNEMYGWDSYFIQVGLLRDGETALARQMADNFLYQIEHVRELNGVPVP